MSSIKRVRNSDLGREQQHHHHHHHDCHQQHQMATRSVQQRVASIRNKCLSFAMAIISALVLILVQHPQAVQGFIKFGYILNTTACDTCDELRTYSGRNVFCCLAQSKCCVPNSLDELDALTTTQIPVNP